MIKTKVAFLEGRLLTSQSEQYKTYSKSFNLKSIQKALTGWKKADPPKRPLLF